MQKHDEINFNGPRTNLKKQKPTDQAIKIKCCYCELYESCKRRALKESYENAGWITYCTYTPNRPGKKRRKKKRRV